MSDRDGLKRRELFEFEDHPALPAFLRTSMTRLLMTFLRLSGVTDVVAKGIINLRKSYPFDHITDLGSGSGGIMPDVLRIINGQTGENRLQLLLTDLYPDPRTIEHFNKIGNSQLSYSAIPQDARQLNSGTKGLHTLINSFHHLSPADARSLLSSAQENRQAVFIYEMAENKIPFVLWLILLPLSFGIMFLMVWMMTPFVRPLGWQQLLFTYLIPVIPILYFWDGQASLMRIYSFEDIQTLLQEPRRDTYRWDILRAYNSKGQEKGYFITGFPVSS